MSTRSDYFTMIERGWPLHPLFDDKTPRTDWKRSSTTDSVTLDHWLTRWPSTLMGIDCEKARIIGIDLDRKNGANGFDSWNRIIETYGGRQPVPIGPAQWTPNNGAHLIGKWPDGLDVPNCAGRLGPGIDIRSHGYLATGPGYTWMDGHGPDVPLAEFPDWLIDLMRVLRKTADAPTPGGEVIHVVGLEGYFLEKYSRSANIGDRNQNGFELACQLRDCGLSFNDALGFMLQYAGRVPQSSRDPYTKTEAIASLKSAFEAPRRKPAGEHG